MILNNISSFITGSFCDWPGKISSIIFVRGCNFRCPTCHNFELLSNIETINFSDILEKLNKNKQWIDHITISGGEPTIYNDLFELVDLLNSNNFKVKVDSNASRPEMIKDLINYVEMFSIDIKGPYEKYPELTGFRITEEQIKENFENNIFPLAKEYPHKFQFRTTLVPLLEHQDILKIQSYPPSSFKIQFQYYQEVS